MLKISQLYTYPIKSLAGISLNSSNVTEKGLEYDRRWMLVNADNKFLTQREYPQMALLQPVLHSEGMYIKSLEGQAKDLFIPFEFPNRKIERVQIWNATCDAYAISDKIDHWFTHILGIKCRLVFMPDQSMRPVDTNSGMKPAGKFTSFSDAYPFLLLSEESISDLNKRSEGNFSIKRFRPNLVMQGGMPYEEDTLTEFKIGSIQFQGLEKCARCAIPNINPEDGVPDGEQEPTRTLSTYRRKGNHIYLGMNLVHSGSGIIHVGDELMVGQKS